MKLWQKNSQTDPLVDKFTVGNDRELDLVLAPFDVIGSIAHTMMLEKVGMISAEEKTALCNSLKKIYSDIESGNFSIATGVEDIHSQVEFLLTGSLGEAGKKIHTGRSRNDQVLLDIKLFTRGRIKDIVTETEVLFKLLIRLSEKHKNDLLPGYTHFQLAMPSSFGLWFGAYAESLADDLMLLLGAYKVANRNPLGSGAGYGSSLPLDREYVTELLGFDSTNYNSVYAQMTRGKTEKLVSAALASIAATLSRLSMDICLYMSQDFGFISFPENLTTGSSIMPHKKNPDVFELIRARCNRLQALPNEMAMITTNLPSGYHRDMQQIKESFIPAFDTLESCLQMMTYMLKHVEIKKDILVDPKYKYLFSVEAVNEQVRTGIPFREAYRNTGAAIREGSFKKPHTDLLKTHSHTGSIGNLANDKIGELMEKTIAEFNFRTWEGAVKRLVEGEL
jgi:argininosuccinate lyase